MKQNFSLRKLIFIFLFTIVGILLVVFDRAFRNRTVFILFVERVIKFRRLFNVVRTFVGNCTVGSACNLKNK
jgi:hypothetical protein